MIAFIDTEVSLDGQRVTDYGAVSEDGRLLLFQLLHDNPLFSGFFLHVGCAPLRRSHLARLFSQGPGVKSLVSEAAVLKLRSGDLLQYKSGSLVNEQGECVAKLSRDRLIKMDELEIKGYKVEKAEVSYILAWRPRDEHEEVAVCLANLQMEKQT